MSRKCRCCCCQHAKGLLRRQDGWSRNEFIRNWREIRLHAEIWTKNTLWKTRICDKQMKKTFLRKMLPAKTSKSKTCYNSFIRFMKFNWRVFRYKTKHVRIMASASHYDFVTFRWSRSVQQSGGELIGLSVTAASVQMVGPHLNEIRQRSAGGPHYWAIRRLQDRVGRFREVLRQSLSRASPSAASQQRARLASN